MKDKVRIENCQLYDKSVILDYDYTIAIFSVIDHSKSEIGF